MNPIYPIYIISKGRWDSRLTSKTLEYMKVPYKIVVEPKEYENYAAVINPDKILVLPDNFSELGMGSIPVRNWVWEHSLANGDKRHWIMDDNIHYFYRFNNNQKIVVGDGTILRIMEIFTDRYENVAFSGPQYYYFIPSKSKRPPFILNTRIYSCILVNNSLPYRWRGRYNEDTDICIRALKDGWCTILFHAFLSGKAGTLTMKGGNTDTIYNKTKNRQEFAQSLKKQHPDIVKIVYRYNRWHHEVNYNVFKDNKLKRKEGLKLEKKINNYGMKLVKVK